MKDKGINTLVKVYESVYVEQPILIFIISKVKQNTHCLINVFTPKRGTKREVTNAAMVYKMTTVTGDTTLEVPLLGQIVVKEEEVSALDEHLSAVSIVFNGEETDV